MTQDQISPPKSDPPLSFVIEAGAWYRHAEIIVQQRLYNYLVAATIMLAAVASVLATTPSQNGEIPTVLDLYRWRFVLGLSVFGALLSLAYAVLGFRQRKFIRLHKDVLHSLARAIEHHELDFLRQFCELQRGGTVELPMSKERLSIGRLERFGSSDLLGLAPAGFAVLFLAIFVLALRNVA